MKSIFYTVITIALFVASTSCKTAKTVIAPALPNTLTIAEKATGWNLLFDGKTMNEWKGWKKDKPDTKWQVENGTMVFNPKADGAGGDIITKEKYEDYELHLEWKISECGNSGIIFGIIEDDKYVYPWMTGPEMQILDDSCHPDGKIVTHRAGDLYDMIETSPNAFKGANVWHQVKIKSKGGAMEFWLNGVKVVEFTMHTPAWDEMVGNSKFKDLADFGKTKIGHLGLQDHHDFVAFRNLKIRRL